MAASRLAAGIATEQSVRILDIDRAQQYGVDQAEHNCIGPDANGQSKKSNRSESRRLVQHPKAVSNIL